MTASASRLARAAIKMTPFAWLGTPLSQPISPTGPGIRHATPRIVPALVQFHTTVVAASCLTPTAIRRAT
jgi:hypothetical protein